MKKPDGDEEAVMNGPVGSWCWKFHKRGDGADQRYCVMHTPDDKTVALPVSEKHQTSVHWIWDGNETAPTLTPSIANVGGWHGFMQAGQMVNA